MTFIRKITLYIFASFVLSFQSTAQYKIEVLDTNTFTVGEGVVLSKTSFRGLSVVDDQTIWVSGSRGTVAKSTDGGKTFSYTQLKGYEKSDFRDIEAFDTKRAIIMSSGTPAYLLKTTDGGQSWKEVYKNTDTAYFLDAMDFWDDKRGILVGDPINGHFVLLQTNDGGDTWLELDTTKTPKAIEGESVFAASGTSLRCWGKSEYGFVSGGSVSNLYRKQKRNQPFKRDTVYLKPPSMGAFSFCVTTDNCIMVGGDYQKDTSQTIRNFTCVSLLKNANDGVSVRDRPIGYKSCIEEIESSTKGFVKSIFIVTGTSGTQIGFYGWLYHSMGFWFKPNIPDTPFHVVRKAKKGKAVFLAGPKGKIGKLVY